MAVVVKVPCSYRPSPFPASYVLAEMKTASVATVLTFLASTLIVTVLAVPAPAITPFAARGAEVDDVNVAWTVCGGPGTRRAVPTGELGRRAMKNRHVDGDNISWTVSC